LSHPSLIQYTRQNFAICDEEAPGSFQVLEGCIAVKRNFDRARADIVGACVKAIVVGIGNELRGDDAVGPTVVGLIDRKAVEWVTLLKLSDDVSALIDFFQGCDVAIIVDATQPGTSPGAIHRFDASNVPLPEIQTIGSTHGLSVGSVLELARVQGQLPRKVLVYGIEGKQFGRGSSLTAEVERAVKIVSKMILEELSAQIIE
jgi:hydrogenase maturation protease